MSSPVLCQDGDDDLGPRYRLTGNKMWISGGDHDITDNIIHLVLAKIPGDGGKLPPGTGGITLFIVPKMLPGGVRNDISVAGLNHKMGYRGTTNCLLNFGEAGGAIGYRLGEGGQGLAIMFHMMNEARIFVGLGAAALAVRGYRQSLDYARERLQGRPASAKDPSSPQRPIIEHADVKRMLLAQKAFAEGALSLILYCAHLMDRERVAGDKTEQARLDSLLGLLTPVAKSWPSEFGLAANDFAIQVHGGYGYTRDFDVEQVYRDNRINPIHEGTHGIQGIDLLGRKILRDKGAGLATLGAEIAQTVATASAIDGLDWLAGQLAYGVGADRCRREPADRTERPSPRARQCFGFPVGIRPCRGRLAVARSGGRHSWAFRYRLRLPRGQAARLPLFHRGRAAEDRAAAGPCRRAE